MAAGARNRAAEGKSTTAQALVNVVKTYIGAGVLGLPYAFRLGGILGGSALMLVLCVLSTYCIHCVIRCKRTPRDAVAREATPHDGVKDAGTLASERTSLVSRGAIAVKPPEVHSFADIGLLAFGPKGSLVVEVVVLTCQVGFVCAYLIIIGETIESVGVQLSKSTIIVFTAVPLVFLSWVRSLKYFAPLSAVVLCVFALGATTILVEGLRFHSDTISRGTDIRALTVYFLRFDRLPLFFGTAVYSFEGINLAIPIEDSMLYPRRFGRTLNQGMVIVTVIFVGFGATTYYCFGGRTDPVILLCLELAKSSRELQVAVQLAFCVVLFLTFPIGMFPIVQIVERHTIPLLGYHVSDLDEMEGDLEYDAEDVAEELRESAENEFSDSAVLYWWCCAVRSVCVVAVVGVTLLIPNFDAVMELFGACSNALATFILPAVFTLRILHPVLQLWEKALLRAIIIFGSLAMCISLYFAVLDAFL
mmetsp:Transcript_7127/g.19098  ORF Transcript_7127/g.19098 Transcript_7127/m.19098 type:complete len:476 (-) Transcript_7127:159-1586(-)